MSTATATATATTTSSSTTTLDYLELCRLCLVKERANVPIFEDEGDVRQIFLKIAACLPVKVSRDDKLPKKICDDCVYKVELFYQFWNTTANAEKQLLEWLGDVGGLEDKEFDVLDTNVMKQEGRDNRLDGSVMQISGHQNNMEIGIIDNMSIIQMPDGSEQFTAVPMDASTTIQVVGSSTQVTHDQSQVAHIEEVESEIEDNSDDGCDNEEGLPVKEETEEEQASRAMETQFVTISGDQAGPSGLQQQKMKETQRNADDPKTQFYLAKIADASLLIESGMNSEAVNDGLIIVPMSNQNEQYQCTICGDMFANESMLNYHHLKAHDEQQTIIAEEADDEGLLLSPDNNPEQDINVYKYKCEQCENEFGDRNTFEDHICHMYKPFKCQICGATFRYMQGLRLHSKLHQPDYVAPQKKHHCEICNKRFCRRQVLLRHMKSHAGNAGLSLINKYVCHICGKSVSSKNYLLVHVRKHTGEKPHVCDHCGKGFISQNYLSVHRRTHTGERPHQCTHCDKRFTQRTTLVVHMRSHTGDKPYTCIYCEKAFASKTMLNSHLKIHAKQNDRVNDDEFTT